MNNLKTFIAASCALAGAVCLLVFLTNRPDAVAQGGGGNEARGDTASRSDHSLNDLKLMEECRRTALEYSRSLRDSPSGDSVLSYRCRVSVQLVDTSQGAASINTVDITLRNDRIRMTGDVVTMARDSSAILLVLPHIRTIYLYDPAAAPARTGDPSELLGMQDTLFARSIVTACGEERRGDGSVIRRITFSPDPRMQLFSRIREFTLTLDTARRAISEIAIIPLYPQTYRSITWAFSDVGLRPVPEEFSRPVVAEVLTGAGALRSKYAGYTLEDHRPGRGNE